MALDYFVNLIYKYKNNLRKKEKNHDHTPIEIKIFL